jgi:hypothetical protein
MSFYDVLELILEDSNLAEVLVTFGAVLLVYFGLFRRRFGSVFDPLVYVFVMASCSTTMLLLMSFHGIVSFGKLSFVMTSLGLFYVGFLIVDSSARPSSQAGSPVRSVSRSWRPSPQAPTLAVLFCANFIVLTVTYTFFGIPLFLESRLAQFVDSGGFGVLGRLTTGLEFSTLVLAFIALGGKRSADLWAKAILVQFIVSSALSGSKGSLLSGLFAWYLSRVYRNRRWTEEAHLPRFMIAFLVFALIAPLFVISVQNAEGGSGIGDVFQKFIIRFAAEGDVYPYFLGNDLIDSVARHDWLAPLREVLAAFRLVSRDTSVNPGFLIIQEVLGVEDPSSGPNSRLAIYLLFFYGYGGIILAPLLGAVLGWARNRVVRRERLSPLAFSLAAAVYLHCCRLEVDPQLTVAGLFGLGLAWPIFWLAAAAGVRKDGRNQRRPSGNSVARPPHFERPTSPGH